MGLVSVVALLAYSLITLAVFKLIPITLTLAGIGAFVLSIGMAVDAEDRCNGYQTSSPKRDYKLMFKRFFDDSFIGKIFCSQT